VGRSASIDSAGPESPKAAQLPGFSWYGKIPGAGDFVSRRMPYALQQFWDRWCAAGMDALKLGNTVSGWEFWRGAPKWAFLLPAQPAVPFGQFGVLAPSCDRVGRNFPFLVTLSLERDKVPLLLPRAATLGLAWSDAISQAQLGRRSVDVLDAGLESALVDMMTTESATDESEQTLPRGMNPSNLPWPNLAATFDVNADESYWWSVPPVSTGFRARTHIGALNSMCFLELWA
jgi:type VI secretion system protein ImpM